MQGDGSRRINIIVSLLIHENKESWSARGQSRSPGLLSLELERQAIEISSCQLLVAADIQVQQWVQRIKDWNEVAAHQWQAARKKQTLIWHALLASFWFWKRAGFDIFSSDECCRVQTSYGFERCCQHSPPVCKQGCSFSFELYVEKMATIIADDNLFLCYCFSINRFGKLKCENRMYHHQDLHRMSLIDLRVGADKDDRNNRREGNKGSHEWATKLLLWQIAAMSETRGNTRTIFSKQFIETNFKVEH